MPKFEVGDRVVCVNPLGTSQGLRGGVEYTVQKVIGADSSESVCIDSSGEIYRASRFARASEALPPSEKIDPVKKSSIYEPVQGYRFICEDEVTLFTDEREYGRNATYDWKELSDTRDSVLIGRTFGEIRKCPLWNDIVIRRKVDQESPIPVRWYLPVVPLSGGFRAIKRETATKAIQYGPQSTPMAFRWSDADETFVRIGEWKEVAESEVGIAALQWPLPDTPPVETPVAQPIPPIKPTQMLVIGGVYRSRGLIVILRAVSSERGIECLVCSDTSCWNANHLEIEGPTHLPCPFCGELQMLQTDGLQIDYAEHLMRCQPVFKSKGGVK